MPNRISVGGDHSKESNFMFLFFLSPRFLDSFKHLVFVLPLVLDVGDILWVYFSTEVKIGKSWLPKGYIPTSIYISIYIYRSILIYIYPQTGRNICFHIYIYIYIYIEIICI